MIFVRFFGCCPLLVNNPSIDDNNMRNWCPVNPQWPEAYRGQRRHPGCVASGWRVRARLPWDVPFLEDHPRTCKWLGSPLFTSHEVRPFIRGPTTPFRGQQRSPWLLTTYVNPGPPSWKEVRIPEESKAPVPIEDWIFRVEKSHPKRVEF